MRFKILYVFVILFSLNSFSGEAQTTKKQALTTVKYRDNVKAPLNSNELRMLKEAYADKLNAYVLSKPQRLKDFKNLLRNRIVVKKITSISDASKYQTISQAGLFDSYNKNLSFDTSYNPNTFNPLKYNLQFFGRGSAMYRIDNTDYFIIIKSQHNN